MYKITKRDLLNQYLRWTFICAETSNNYERLQSLALTNSFIPRLKKLYAHDKEAYKEALQRYLMFFNSEGSVGTIIHGVVLSMEEQRANGDENVTPEIITAIKTGLMGPVAGMGDTIVQGTIKPLILGMACTLAMAGNPLGAAVAIIEGIAVAVVGYFAFTSGYKLGRDSITKILQSGAFNRIIYSASILGLFMMGALSSSYVKITTPITFPGAKDPIALQTILDSIIPGLLPLVAIMGIYVYFNKKGQNYNKVVLFTILISLVASFFKLLG